MKIDRLIGILSILLQQEKVTAPYLADKFEVSRRTINRDIEEICMAGIPLVTTQGQNGGISIMEGFCVDRTLLTSVEMQDILTGLKSLDSISGTKRYQQLMDKLSVTDTDILQSKQHIAVDLSCWNRSAIIPKIEIIQEAIDNKSVITFTYYSERGETSRKVEPYVLVFQWSSWYVWGYCRTRCDYRMFKLNRMMNLVKSDENYEQRPDQKPDFSHQRYQYPHTIHAKILFQTNLRWRLIDEYGPECFKEQKDHTLIVEYDFVDEKSLLSWVLSFGRQAELLEPVTLRNKMKTLIKDMTHLYEHDI